MASISGEITIKSALTDQVRLQGTTYKTTLVPNAGAGADTTITFPVGTATLMSNPLAGTMIVTRASGDAEDDDTALLEIGSTSADNAGQLAIFTEAADSTTRFAVTDAAVTASLPFTCADDIATDTLFDGPALYLQDGDTAANSFRLIVVSGSLVVQHSDDTRGTWSAPLQIYTPA